MYDTSAPIIIKGFVKKLYHKVGTNIIEGHSAFAGTLFNLLLGKRALYYF
jgi:hypothetical protein